MQIVEREIMAPLRHEVFHSLAELNHSLALARERVNDRPFQKLAGSRRSVFEETERATLRPLPAERYELAEWKTAKVNHRLPHLRRGATVSRTSSSGPW